MACGALSVCEYDMYGMCKQGSVEEAVYLIHGNTSEGDRLYVLYN